jgi:hypothetical protein
MIDYRIAFAMINYNQNPARPDPDREISLAQKMKLASSQNFNKLEFLLSKHLNTKTVKPIVLSSINDFPKLLPEELIENIFFGTFQMQLSKSYLSDLIR